jgi:AmmeMemoRadiSam system protein B
MDKVDPRNVRRSISAGRIGWYHPADTKEKLERTIDGYLANVEETLVEGRLIGLISPHAGYVYSGQIAAYAYKQLEGLSFEAVVVISPIHGGIYLGHFVVTDKAYYETPLGLIEVDSQLVEAVSSQATLSRIGQDDEHSLELQLPFLQRVLGDFKLTPIMMGNQSLSSCRALGQALATALKGKKALLAASTDLSHYHSYDTAVRLDQVVLDHIEAYDPEGLAQAMSRGECEACGGGPVIAVMLAARELGADKAKVLKYANSGDVTGDRTQGVVGYAAVALYREGRE